MPEKFRNTKAHTQYRLSDGTRVPGVTTVLGVLAKPALVPWANRLGLQGIDSSKYVDTTAQIGTLAHHLIECDLKGDKPDTDGYSAEQIDKAENAFLKFLEWKDRQDSFECLKAEHPLVSEMYRYGGTIDCVARLNGRMALIDFKTSKAIWPEHLHQLAAYHALLCGAERDWFLADVRILRIGRTENEGFEERIVTGEQLKPHWEIFKHCLGIYRLKKAV